jgi:hypothetical protein
MSEDYTKGPLAGQGEGNHRKKRLKATNIGMHERFKKLTQRDQRERKIVFWKDKIIYCPHCRKKFKYVDMWAALAKDLKSVWKIMEFISRSYSDVRDHIEHYYLDLVVQGTYKNMTYHDLAMKANYNSIEEMIYELKVKRGWSYQKMSRILGKPEDELKQIVEYLFDPVLWEGAVKRRNRFKKAGEFDITNYKEEKKNEYINRVRRSYKTIDKKMKKDEENMLQEE